MALYYSVKLQWSHNLNLEISSLVNNFDCMEDWRICLFGLSKCKSPVGYGSLEMPCSNITSIVT